MACKIAFGSHLTACTALAGYGSNCGQMVVDRHSSATLVPFWRYVALDVAAPRKGAYKVGHLYVCVCVLCPACVSASCNSVQI